MSSIGITWPEPTKTNQDDESDDESESCTSTEPEDSSESGAEEQVSSPKKEEVSEENKAKGKVSENGGSNSVYVNICVFQTLVEACANKFHFAVNVCPYPTHAPPALQVKLLQLLSRQAR